MTRCNVVVGGVLVFAAVAGCGGSSGSSADAGSGGDGTVGADSPFGGSSGTGSSGVGSSGTGASSGTGGTSSGGTSSGGTSSGGTSSGAASSGGASSSSGASSGGSSGADAGAAYDPSVYQHHKNPSRNGLYIDSTLSSGTAGNAATMHVVTGATGTVTTTFMGTTSTGMYAQPLYVENGPGGVETFIVASTVNHLTAFNATTGAVIWDQGPSTYGDPASAGCPAGAPSTPPILGGITGTPIIDPASPINSGAGVIYFDSLVTSGGALKHMAYAVKLSDGTVISGWPVDIAAKMGSSFVSSVQNQRGALQLVNGVLYIPYGGFDGDCYSSTNQPYYGWVVGVPVGNPQTPLGWHTSAERGGIWAPGSLPTDGTSVFPVTGNTSGATTWGGGEAVIRLAATATGPTFSNSSTDYFAPTNWESLDSTDTDLGGASNVLFDMPGSMYPHLVAAAGKDGNFYLMDRDNLGGVGGQIHTTAIANGQLKGAPAAYSTSAETAYVVFHIEGSTGAGCSQNGNLVAVKIVGSASAKPTVSVAWCASDSGLGSPMVTTTDGTSDPIVWAANNALWGYDGVTGAKVYTGTKTQMSESVTEWNTPIAIGKGRLAVAVKGQIYVFSAP